MQIDSCHIRWLARFEWKKTWWISSFNSTEKRLARVLLLLANFGQDGKPQQVIPRISQETLSQIVSASRPRVSSFMNKFRKLGFIDYNGGLQVNGSLLRMALKE